MRMSRVFACALLVQGCSSNNTAAPGETDGGPDGSTQDTGTPGTGEDSGHPDTGLPLADGGVESGGPDAADGGSDALAEGGGCSGDWLDATALSPSIVPDAGVVILHAAGSGTQNYQCQSIASDGGVDGGATYGWVFIGPQATLDDCNATLIGHHFASEAGAAAPEWQTLDGTYVIGSKRVAYTPDGGAGSVPWLLVQATAHGGSGTLSNADWVSRANTDGGIAPPSTTCDSTSVGTTQDVGYTADYYFWGP